MLAISDRKNFVGMIFSSFFFVCTNKSLIALLLDFILFAMLLGVDYIDGYVDGSIDYEFTNYIICQPVWAT